MIIILVSSLAGLQSCYCPAGILLGCTVRGLNAGDPHPRLWSVDWHLHFFKIYFSFRMIFNSVTYKLCRSTPTWWPTWTGSRSCPPSSPTWRATGSIRSTKIIVLIFIDTALHRTPCRHSGFCAVQLAKRARFHYSFAFNEVFTGILGATYSYIL